MILNEIVIGIGPVSAKDYYQGSIPVGEFNLSLCCMSEMYWRYLRKQNTKTKSLQKLMIFFDTEYSYEDKIVGSAIITTPFDFSNYFSLNDYGKKKILVDIIHENILAIADRQQIDKSKLQEAYDYCLQNNLENRWFVEDKTIMSLSKKYYGSIECFWDLDFFQATAIIYDKNKQEIKRKVLFKEPSNSAPFGWYIYYTKPIWIEKDGKEQLVFNPKNMFFDKTKNDYWEVDPD